MSWASELLNVEAKQGDAEKNAGLTTPDDIERFDDIPYGPDATWNVLDIYRPKGTQRRIPTIIDVHGGGWSYGDKETYQFYCMSLAQQGFAVVNFTYRLAPANPFPAGMQDVDAAVRFALDHAEEYGLDLDRVFLVGDSAGAHMAAMYACLCTNRAYAREVGILPPEGFLPKALALNCGVYDLGAAIEHEGDLADFLRALIGDLLTTEAPVEELVDLVSPARHVTDAFPPAYVMTATGDFLRYQPDYLLSAFRAHGVAHEFKLWGTDKNVLGHVFHCDLRLTDAHACNREEMDFLKRYC